MVYWMKYSAWEHSPVYDAYSPGRSGSIDGRDKGSPARKDAIPLEINLPQMKNAFCPTVINDIEPTIEGFDCDVLPFEIQSYHGSLSCWKINIFYGRTYLQPTWELFKAPLFCDWTKDIVSVGSDEYEVDNLHKIKRVILCQLGTA
jgi:hypothetical protein